MNFEKELTRGNFFISICPKCEFTVWPPNNICSKCFGKTNWKKILPVGKIIEFSKESDRFFCLAEFQNNLRLIGTIKSNETPVVGQKVIIENTTIHDGNYSFVLRLS